MPRVKASAPAKKADKGDLESSEKGQMILKLLARWWYIIEWPDAEAVAKPSPALYEPLEGFPGVHICTKGGELGKIVDYRDKASCPSWNTFAAMSAEDLRTKLVGALRNQQAELIAHEGDDAPYVRTIKKELKKYKKLDAKSTDTAWGKTEKKAKKAVA